jgi:hypothetical protein
VLFEQTRADNFEEYEVLGVFGKTLQNISLNVVQIQRQMSHKRSCRSGVYSSSQTSSIRQPLYTLLAIVVRPYLGLPAGCGTGMMDDRPRSVAQQFFFDLPY